MGPQRLLIAGQAIARGGHLHVAGDKADAAMPKLDQILSGVVGALPVRRAHGRHLFFDALVVHQHERESNLPEMFDDGLQIAGEDQHQPVGHPTGDVINVRRFLGGLAMRSVEQQVILSQLHLSVNAADDLPNIPRSQIGHQDGQRLRAAAGQAAGTAVDNIAQATHRLVHPLSGLRPDVRRVIDDPRNGAVGGAGSRRNIVNRSVLN